METKRCSQCRRNFPLDQYNWKNKARGIRYSACKACSNAGNKKRYQSNKRYYVEKAQKRKVELRRWLMQVKAAKGCASCGESHPACLLFHHPDPNLKAFEIADDLLTRSRAKLEAEIEKCVVLCSNCHCKLHFRLRGGLWP